MGGSLSTGGLSVRFGSQPAVRQVTLAVPRPGWWGVLGANGSGKTTLLRAMAGRLTPDEGHIVVNGQDLTGSPARRAEIIGYAPALHTLPESLSVKELISLAARARRAEPDRPVELFEALELGEMADRRIGVLSSGMRQRVALFCAFLGAPGIVLLDEPFNWLDPVAAYDVKRCLSDLARSTVLITALHDVATFATRCSGGVLMNEGRIGRTFDTADIARARLDLPAFEREVYEALRRLR